MFDDDDDDVSPSVLPSLLHGFCVQTIILGQHYSHLVAKLTISGWTTGLKK